MTLAAGDRRPSSPWLTPSRLAELAHAPLVHGGAPVDQPLGRSTIDSRDVRAGDVFWALPGAHSHGAQWAGDAFKRGAAGAIVPRIADAIPPGCWAIQAADPRSLLNRAADWQRRQFTGPVVAVTGSVGKTTTRQLIHAVLASQTSVHVSPRNFNNDLGLSLTLLGLTREHQQAVLELGTSAPGEIDALADRARPHVAVITAIGEAHLQNFQTRMRLAEEKLALVRALPGDGLAVLSGDDPLLRRLAANHRDRVIWFGRHGDCEIKAETVACSNGWLRMRVAGNSIRVALWGRHHVGPVLAALAVGRHFRISFAAMAEALSQFTPLPQRCRVDRMRGVHVIDDSYNASPTAMRAALDLLREFPARGRKIFLCGGMHELGAESQGLHEELGQQVVTRSGADLLVACGTHADCVAEGARRAGMRAERIICCADGRSAATRLASELQQDDVVLVKGSRREALEQAIAFWRSRHADDIPRDER